MKQVDIIVPIYNEEENILTLYQEVKEVFSVLDYNYQLTFIDDGSTDQSLPVLRHLKAQDPLIHYISFSRNFGHQNALKAGMDQSTGDCVITLDGDLQHPPELIPTLLKYWEEGYDVVYTLRSENEKEVGFFKRISSRLFYRLLNRLADLEMEKGSADFRLINKKVVRILQGLEEHELFFRGLVKWVGFRQVGISYEPRLRTSGQSKYTFLKMMRFAIQGITSFSTKPLYLAAYLGIIFSLFSVLYVPYALISYFFGHAISGWTSVIMIMTFFGGLQLCILGIIGLYLGKVFTQAKNRPLYIIKE